MGRLLLVTLVAVMIGATGTVFAAVLEDFDGAELHDRWRYRDPVGNGDYRIEGGKLVLDLSAGADMYIQGTDGGVLFLMEPPALDDYVIEMKVNPAVTGTQPPATHIGPVFFNEDEWAYSAWGPYAATDIRLEDCIGANYRWRDQTQVGVDQGDVAIDSDVWLRVVKTGTTLEFFAKGDEGDDWVSGGTDELLGPHYAEGDYEVGIVAKSWGGSVDSTFEFDFFNIPEIAAVDSAGKLATVWAAVKQ